MEKIVIVGKARTAIGNFGGALKDISPIDLGALVVKKAINRAGIEPETIDRVVIGENIQVTPRGDPARQVVLKAGLPISTDDYSINMNCSSGLRAVVCAAQDLLLGDSSMAVAGGIESMSRTPFILEGARWGYRFGNGTLIDFLADYILGDAAPMAELVASKFNISREEQDQWAYQSHIKAIKAIDEGKFKESIVPVEIPTRNGTLFFDTDEHPRRDTSLEKLAKLKPSFKSNGTVTAGNASGINDGGAALVLTTMSKARELNKEPLAILKGWASAGIEPELFGLGPVPAVKKLLKKVGLTLGDIGLIELNEAFASSTIAVVKELGLNPEVVNVNGGAIALGHSVGATGVIMMIKLIDEMRLRNVKYGIATMCVGSGQGMTVLLELPD